MDILNFDSLNQEDQITSKHVLNVIRVGED
jgi:hypothetical protein